MYVMLTNLVWLLWVLIGAPYILCEEERTGNDLEFCSFFNNRKPTPQQGLRNCTWFKNNSCCRQEELEATFMTVKPIPGSSLECQRYSNYLMCYICAPYQNIFYRQEKLTVCEEFCNAWYDACSSANLKGSVIGELYPNGSEFCLKRNFQCESIAKNNCFIGPSLAQLSRGHQHSVWLVGTLLMSLAIVQSSHLIGISQLHLLDIL